MAKNQRRNDRNALKKYRPTTPKIPKPKPQNRGKLIFRVLWSATINGEKHERIEEECSWFLIDQQGKFYSHGPFRPIEPCRDYDSVEPLIKIGDEYLSVSEIESRLSCTGKKPEAEIGKDGENTNA